MMRPYVVCQGDYLAKIAYAQGFDAEEVWGHARNEELRRLRDPDVLYPGDVLRVPVEPPAGRPLQIGQANAFVADVPERSVTLVLRRDDDGKALANEPYVVEGLGKEIAGTTDVDGVVRLDVPVVIDHVELLLFRRGLRIPVLVGHIDPISTPSGQRGRLENLGFGGDALVGEEDALRRAILDFQTSQGLAATGVADADTLRALAAAHGV
jgi:hypothetical protein